MEQDRKRAERILEQIRQQSENPKPPTAWEEMVTSLLLGIEGKLNQWRNPAQSIKPARRHISRREWVAYKYFATLAVLLATAVGGAYYGKEYFKSLAPPPTTILAPNIRPPLAAVGPEIKQEPQPTLHPDLQMGDRVPDNSIILNKKGDITFFNNGAVINLSDMIQFRVLPSTMDNLMRDPRVGVSVPSGIGFIVYLTDKDLPDRTFNTSVYDSNIAAHHNVLMNPGRGNDYEVLIVSANPIVRELLSASPEILNLNPNPLGYVLTDAMPKRIFSAMLERLKLRGFNRPSDLSEEALQIIRDEKPIQAFAFDTNKLKAKFVSGS